MEPKRERLVALLREFGSVAVGYSGGVDSVLLARVASDTLGPDRVLAVTGRSASLPSWMEGTASEVARRFGIRWLEVETGELDDPRYAANPSDRCYFCKSELWSRLRSVASEHGLRVVADGANVDDLSDHRPGAVAGAEHGVRSPLLEAGLTKADIREWSRELGLPTWDQPAAPCLASRIPHGIPVTVARLRRVEAAEEALRALGLRDFRVRHHEEVARLEIHPAELGLAFARLEAVTAAVLGAGYASVALDVEGYRRGALNEAPGDRPLVQLGGGRPSGDARVAAATRALEGEGLHPAAVREAGHRGEIALVGVSGRVDEPLLHRAAAAATRVRSAGFRFLALALDPAAG